MHYLGGISGSGMLKCDGKELARATYDFDGFYAKGLGVIGSGEIRVAAAVLREVFGRKGVQLVTDEGHLLDLRFSDRILPSTSDVTHVDVKGQLPAGWRSVHH